MGSTNVSKKWLITGASQGLGLATALAALKAGHRVLAGARDPAKAAKEHPEVERSGGQWLTLDVASPETQIIVRNAIEDFGGIDVVVNNAGYWHGGTIEDLTEEEMQQEISVNYLGPIRVLKGALSAMRAQKSGFIVHNGGIFGLYPCPSGAMYNSTKAAADMIYETLKVELAPFNIRTIIINAGAVRSNVLANAQQPKNGFMEEYLSNTAVGTCVKIMANVAKDPELIPGDPNKFGKRVVEIVDETGYGEGLGRASRIIFGKDGLKLARKKLEVLGSEVEASEKIALSIDVDGCTSVGMGPVADM